MLLAYIDEIGETGAYVSRDHPRFNTSPAFGYAGFVVPADRCRSFGHAFTQAKRTLFAKEIAAAEHPGRWERKGSEVFRPQTVERHPQQLRVFAGLVRQLRNCGGSLFFYADEKPLGTPGQTKLDHDQRETQAMREALNRIARHADSSGSNVMVMIDQINEKTRAARLPQMYSHIFGRAAEHPEMRRIIEPPMHIDSALSSNVQFADWVAAFTGRAIDYQLIDTSPHRWVTSDGSLQGARLGFTHESKLHLWHRSIDDLHRNDIFRTARALYPSAAGQLLGRQIDPAIFRRMKAAAERASEQSPRPKT